jgi:hypothetical protein
VFPENPFFIENPYRHVQEMRKDGVNLESEKVLQQVIIKNPGGIPRGTFLFVFVYNTGKPFCYEEMFILQITNPVRLNIFSVHLTLFALKRRQSTDGRS